MNPHHWPFPLINGKRTPASQQLLERKHQRPKRDDFSDVEDAPW